MNRRRFVKYAGATAAVVGASAIGLDYVLSPRPVPVNQSTVTLNPMRSTSTRTNHPPVMSGFEFEPKYLDPTTEQTVRRAIEFYDVDNDPLAATWFLDGKEVGHGDTSTTQLPDGRNVSRSEFLTKLPEGSHVIEATVSDDIEIVKTPSWYGEPITVEPDQTYPTKPLKIKYKGMIYAAARFVPEFTATPSANPGIDEMEEQLTTIRSELGCNAVCLRAGGGYEDNLIEACKIALRLNFDRIYAEMKYMRSTAEETAQKLAEFAPRIAELRETSDALVFMIGSEFVYSIKGILPGEQWRDQLNYAVQNYNDYVKRIREQIPKSFHAILSSVKRSYDYPVAYSAEVNEANFVPWQDPAFESVSIDLYFADPYGMNEQWMLNYIEKFRQFGKPINWSEFGCYTYRGGGDYGFITPAYATSPYDEDEQAKYIKRYCNTFSRANVEGAYCYIYNEEWDKGLGLYNSKKRKKGFYMYKSYQRKANPI